MELSCRQECLCISHDSQLTEAHETYIFRHSADQQTIFPLLALAPISIGNIPHGIHVFCIPIPRASFKACRLRPQWELKCGRKDKRCRPSGSGPRSPQRPHINFSVHETGSVGRREHFAVAVHYPVKRRGGVIRIEGKMLHPRQGTGLALRWVWRCGAEGKTAIPITIRLRDVEGPFARPQRQGTIWCTKGHVKRGNQSAPSSARCRTAP